jgi:AcrR family transcriptional regulator
VQAVDSPVREPSRREQILAAALAAFNARGVAGASIDDIRKRSGASVGSIYHHFGGKDELAGAIYLEGLGDYQRGMLATLQAAGSTRAGVEAVVRHHLEWIEARPELARFLLLGRDASVVIATERPLRQLNRGFFAAIRRWTEPRAQAGELLALSPELLSALWIGPSQELARLWLAGQVKTKLSDAAEVLAAAAWASLSTQALTAKS